MRAQLLPVLVLAGLAACASPPPIPSLTLGPDPADTLDDLVVTEDNGLPVAFQWFRDDEPVDVEGERVPASFTARGERWTVRATAWGEDTTHTVEAGLTIRNARPRVTIGLAPEVPEAGDPLAVAIAASDPDGDPLTTRIEWSVDGVEQGDLTGDRVPVDRTRRGQVWRVVVAANDGFAWSDEVVEEVTIEDAPPELLSASLTPEQPVVTDTLIAEAVVVDPDGDATALAWTWIVAGETVQKGSSPTLAPGPFVRGDLVEARLGINGGEPVTVGRVTVRNSPPARPPVQITAEPEAGEPLRCIVPFEPSDADGDSITAYDIDWSRDGVPWAGATTTVHAGDTVPAGITAGEQLWRCTVRASDGTDWGEVNSASVEVDYAGFGASQTVAGRTLTCASITNTIAGTTCNGLRVEGQAFPNGLTCTTGWSSEASPWTSHADLCELVTGNRSFRANYTCGVLDERVTFAGGLWGSRDDNGLTEDLECRW